MISLGVRNRPLLFAVLVTVGLLYVGASFYETDVEWFSLRLWNSETLTPPSQSNVPRAALRPAAIPSLSPSNSEQQHTTGSTFSVSNLHVASQSRSPAAATSSSAVQPTLSSLANTASSSRPAASKVLHVDDKAPVPSRKATSFASPPVAIPSQRSAVSGEIDPEENVPSSSLRGKRIRSLFVDCHSAFLTERFRFMDFNNASAHYFETPISWFLLQMVHSVSGSYDLVDPEKSDELVDVIFISYCSQPRVIQGILDRHPIKPPVIYVTSEYVGARVLQDLTGKSGATGELKSAGNGHTSSVVRITDNSGTVKEVDTLYDLFFGFRLSHLDNVRHFYVPLWVYYVDWDHNQDIYKELWPEMVSRSSRPFSPSDLSKKEFFSGYCASKDSRGRFSRSKFVVKVGEMYRNVTAPCKDQFNTAERLTANKVGTGFGGALAKMVFMEKCKFCMALEHSSRPGYVTEKILQCFAARSVPIYWGDRAVFDDFNPDAFLFRNDYDSDEAFIERIAEVDQNDELYLKMQREPIFRPDRLTPGKDGESWRGPRDRTPWYMWEKIERIIRERGMND